MAYEDSRKGVGVVSGGGGPNSLPASLSGIGVCSVSTSNSLAVATLLDLEILGVRGVVSPPPRRRHSPVLESSCASRRSLNAWLGSACNGAHLRPLSEPSSTSVFSRALVSQPGRHSPSHRPGLPRTLPNEPAWQATPTHGQNAQGAASNLVDI